MSTAVEVVMAAVRGIFFCPPWRSVMLERVSGILLAPLSHTMDDEQAIQGFLQTDDGQFCDDCLGGSLGLASEEVKIAILTWAADFVRTYSRCTACSQTKVVTRRRLVA